MRALPPGTVTFLFTDIEGSTRLLQELGDGYVGALGEHRRLLRAAFVAHGGVEVDTQGDAFFVAFARASDAVAAAAEGQAALEGGPVRVRMGLHTGEPAVTDEGYVGVDVHRAARVAAAGHGGQVLLSQSTRDLVAVGMRDLGEHRLKDLSAPERLFQLGAGEFPRLKTLYGTNLPVPATSFLGRERELREIGELLARDEVRLLTLTGPGGTGKTRLALQVAGAAAEGYPDGVWWVQLSGLRDSGLVLESAAQALGGAGPLREQIEGRRLLLLLDNFEHLVVAAPELTQLLRECPGLDLLVTSRELLQLSGEQAYPVASLVDEEAIQLFVARARAVQPDFIAAGPISELCSRLDDLPLAIELAAARTRAFTPEEILDRLARRLDFLKAGRDADPRQQTLRATIEWSYDLLDDDERSLFARLAVFAGGCTLESAEEICRADPETLLSLLDKSLVRRRGDGRFWMLDTIRELATERLEASGESEGLRRRHAEYFRELAEGAGLNVESIAAGGAQRYDVALPEHDNFRAAIDWTFGADPELGLRLAAALENFWVTQNPFEGMHYLEKLLALAADAPIELRAQGVRSLGSATILSGDYELGARRYAESLELYEQAGDEWGIAVLLHRLAGRALQLGDLERARELLEGGLSRARSLQSPPLESQALGSLGELEYLEGHCERALELARESADLAHTIGFTWWEMHMLDWMADLALELGRPEEATGHARSALLLGHRIHDRQETIHVLAQLAAIAAGSGESARAGRLWGAIEAEERRGRLGLWKQVRERMAQAVLGAASPEFDRGRVMGASLSLDEAVEEALADA